MKSIREQMTAEFVGAFSLVFVGAGAVTILGFRPDVPGMVGIALAHGLILAVMVSNLGHISGGHFNPAVTVGAWVAGKIETVRALLYIVAQFVGAAAGAGLLRLALPERIWKQTNLGLPTVGHQFGISTPKALVLEAVFAFFLVFTVFAVAIDDRGTFKSVAGFPIGLVLAVDILVGGFLTGASVNPVRSFGPALVTGEWKDFWIYVAGPLAGGIIAASIYWFSFLRGRVVVAPRTDTPIGGGPEEDLPAMPGGDESLDEDLADEDLADEDLSDEDPSDERRPASRPEDVRPTGPAPGDLP